MRGRARPALVGLCITLMGCAGLQNSPQQEYAWTCIEACRADLPPQCQIESVSTEGRIAGLCTSGSLANWDNFNRCLAKQYRERPYNVWLKERGG